MGKLIELRRKRSEKVTKIEEIANKALEEDRDLTEAEETAITELKAEIASVDKRIALAEEVVRLKGDEAQPIRLTGEDGDPEPHRTYPQPKQPAEKGADVGCMVRSLAACKGLVPLAAQHAANVLKNERVAKALAAGDLGAGGALVPPDFVADVIELLRPMSVVRASNPIMVPMPNGSTSIPRVQGGATAGYVGENQNAPKTEQTFGNVQFTEKKLAALVPVSNDLLRVPGVLADNLVRDDLVSAMAQAEDVNFIRSTGSQYSPKGMRYWAASGNIIPANGTINLANVTFDLSRLTLALENGNVKMRRPGWIMAPRTKMYLMTVRDGNGNYAFRAEMLTGMLWSYPYKTTTQIPVNLGGGSDESEIYLADFADVAIADSMALELSVSDTAAYHDGSQVQAAFSLDQTVIRAIAKHDFGCRHPESIAVLTALKWAPTGA